MIRTTLSFCALFGALLLGSKLLHESSRPQPSQKSAAPESALGESPAPPAAPAVRPVEASTKADVSANPGTPLHYVSYEEVSYEEDLTEKIDAGDTSDSVPAELSLDSEASHRPIKSLEELLLEDSAANDKRADEKPAEKNPSGDASPPATDSASEPELTSEMAELRQRLRTCLAWYYFRPENVATRSPWGSMHWMLAYGVDSQLIADGRRVNAIGYLNYNGVCNGQRLFYLSGNKLAAQVGVGVQGHAGQYLAMLAQSRVKTDYPMLVDGKQFTVADLIEHEKATCRPASELTFKLISLSHYLKSDEKWKSNDGQDWDIPRLIKEELAQPINGAACGGTHRMTGFSYAVRKREQRKEPIEGQWKRAKKYVEEFHEYTFKLQNPDGSFSTEWFVMRADNPDLGRRVQTTGHIVEWLAFSLNKDQLTEPRMVKSVSYLTDVLNDHRQEKWSIGPLGHALHALAMYDERVFGGKPGTREEILAEIRKQELKR